MELFKKLQSLALVPVPHHVLVSLLGGMKRPNDKIHEMIHKGWLIPLKKGLYIPGDAISHFRPDPVLVANHLSGPSYVSLDYALSYYNMIPERIHTVTSVSLKRSCSFQNPVGVFSYRQAPSEYYPLGIEWIEIGNQIRALIASREKALIDKITLTPGIRVRSTRQAAALLFDDLRLDEQSLSNLRKDLIREWLPWAPKTETLQYIIQILSS